MPKRPYNVDPRDELVPLETLERIADEPTGGSGVGVFITGRIQSMARELLQYRKKDEGNGQG